MHVDNQGVSLCLQLFFFLRIFVIVALWPNACLGSTPQRLFKFYVLVCLCIYLRRYFQLNKILTTQASISQVSER